MMRMLGTTLLMAVTAITLTAERKAPAIRSLGTLPGSGISAGSLINDRGQVVGTSAFPDDTQHSFIWRAGTMIDLGTLGAQIVRPFDLNDRGQVVGTR